MDNHRNDSAEHLMHGSADVLLGDLAEHALHHIGASAAFAAQGILEFPGHRTDIRLAGGERIIPAALAPGNDQCTLSAFGSLTGGGTELGNREKIGAEEDAAPNGRPAASLDKTDKSR